MKPNIIVSYPKNCDYPLWRQYIKENRELFNKVIVVFTPATGFDYSKFLVDELIHDDVKCLNSITPQGRDWRDQAVNQALDFLQPYSHEWVWFTEQDFIVKDGFWDFVEKNSNNFRTEAISVYQGDRMHPCSLFIKTTLLNKINTNFGIVEGKLDHFGLIQKHVEKLTNVVKIPENLYYHYNGFSSNWSLLSNGQQPNYQPEEFKKYLQKSLNCGVNLHPKYEEIAKSI